MLSLQSSLLSVGDLDRSIDFYRCMLSLRLVLRGDQGTRGCSRSPHTLATFGVAEQSATSRIATSPVRATTLATRRGRLTLVLICAAGFIASVPVALANVVMPIIRRDLHMSVQSLQSENS
jgi:hypothetical protein